jgi:glycosyltransferase involved in cell wall biosynthesis
VIGTSGEARRPEAQAPTDELRPGISVVVPVYRSAETLPELARRLIATVEPVSDVYEIILVEDCSPDASWSIIEGLTTQHPTIRGIRLSRNYGQHNALLCGIRSARFDTTVTLDDDLQNPPEEIPKLLALLGPSADVVYGTPITEAHGFLRDVASRITKIALQEAMGADVARNVSTFRVFRTRLRDAFQSYRGPHVSIDVLLTWGSTRFAHTPVAHAPRRVGQSGYTLRKLIAHALNMATGFSTVPLQLASFIGFAFFVFGLAVLLYVFANYLINGPNNVPGFAFITSMIAIFGGAQLFALGIIGEYLARMHFRAMDRPTYLVREVAEVDTATGTLSQVELAGVAEDVPA